MDFPISAISSSELRIASDPGITGMPAAFMVALAFTLSPICSITSGEGPMKTIPWS